MFITKCRNVESPFKATPDSGAWDFCVPNDVTPFVLMPGEGCKIPSGIKAIVPKGHALIAYNKSGISSKHLLVKTSEFVDADYHGEIHLCLVNCGTDAVHILPGMPLVQFALHVVNNNPYTMVDQATFDRLAELSQSERGCNGFGNATKIWLKKSQNVRQNDVYHE